MSNLNRNLTVLLHMKEYCEQILKKHTKYLYLYVFLLGWAG